jgi:hypothetical protein
MKRTCLLIVVPALLVALGFAQTPPASSNTDPTSIKGCLGGSDGNYTLIEDNTGHNFKITTSSVDLKPHLAHDVTLIGQKATTGAADGSFAVTSLNMISEHCAAAAAAPVGSVSTPADTLIATPPPAAAIPAATIPPTVDTSTAPAAPSAGPVATVTTPPAEPAVTPNGAAAATAPAPTVPPAVETASAPAAAATIAPNTNAPAEPAGTQIVVTPAPVATAPTPAEPANAPAAATIAPDATARTETVVTPKAATAHRTRVPPNHPRRSETPTAAAPPAETATPVADAAKLPVTDSAPSETANTPDAAAATTAVTAKKGSPWLWISIAVVVLIMGTLVPLINRWRKRKLLKQSSAQNLSFSHRTDSEPGNSDMPTTRKAA